MFEKPSRPPHGNTRERIKILDLQMGIRGVVPGELWTRAGPSEGAGVLTSLYTSAALKCHLGLEMKKEVPFPVYLLFTILKQE